MKKAFLPGIFDSITFGHLKLFEEAKNRADEIVVALYNDEMCEFIRDIPENSFENRKMLLESLNLNLRVIEQGIDFSATIREENPMIIIHGDRWNDDNLHIKKTIEDIVDLSSSSCEFLEVEYTEKRTKRTSLASILRRQTKPILVLEAHSPLSASIAESVKIGNKGFDCIWSSSLTDSTLMCLPDNEVLSVSERVNKIQGIFHGTKLPLIYDGDTGGKTEHFSNTVRLLENAGVSAVVIEDKIGLKQNSLFGNDVFQEQDTVEGFCEKIRTGLFARKTSDFMIFARCESLILDKGIDDALRRCFAYVEAGASGIMIHSRKKDPSEIKDFIRLFKEEYSNIPIIVVPTTFNDITADELYEIGANIIIYANHMLRASYNAMSSVAKSILENGRTLEIEPKIMDIKKILTLIGQ